jgi:Spy/CpxP family protein refolding chaperone
MKKCIITGIILAINIASLSAQVQRKSTPKPVADSTAPATMPGSDTSAHKSKKAIMRELNLSKTQKQKVREMHQAAKSEKDKINNDPSLNEAAKKEKLKALKQQQAEQMKTILTDEQKAKLRAVRKEKGKRKKTGETDE